MHQGDPAHLKNYVFYQSIVAGDRTGRRVRGPCLSASRKPTVTVLWGVWEEIVWEQGSRPV